MIILATLSFYYKSEFFTIKLIKIVIFYTNLNSRITYLWCTLFSCSHFSFSFLYNFRHVSYLPDCLSYNKNQHTLHFLWPHSLFFPFYKSTNTTSLIQYPQTSFSQITITFSHTQVFRNFSYILFYISENLLWSFYKLFHCYS